MQAPMLQTM
jgi:hypothetical protein